MSDNNENPTKTETQTTTEPIVLFNGGSVRLLMLLHGTPTKKEPIFQIVLDAPNPALEGAPNGSIRMADLAMLHQLTGEALRQAISATSSMISPAKPPAPPAS